MARELSEVLKELDASYNPQRQSIQERIAALPAQAEAEIEGLKGQQTQAFDSILSGARSRGLGFSGIPLGEQATYTSSQFLPAVARVRQSQNEGQRSLTDALNNINLDQNKYAQSIRQAEIDRDWQREQFERQLAAQERAKAAEIAASRATAAAPTFGGGKVSGSSVPTVTPEQQKAYNIEQGLRNAAKDNGDVYVQTANSLRTQARGGNQDAIYKLKLLAQFRQEATGTYPKGLFVGVPA